MLSYQDLLDIGLSPDAKTLQDRLVAAVGTLGFGLSAGTLIRGRLASRKASVHSFGNPPAGFVEASKSLDAGLKDPLLTAMMARPGVLTYDQSFYASAGAGEMWENQAPFGYRHGMAVSVHEFSHLEMFCFGVDGPDPLPASPKARLELEGALRVIGLHAREAVLRFATPPGTLDPGQVTKPELEALRWAANAQVVSKRGNMVVITHPGQSDTQRRAARKLGARSTSQAVLRAIDGGLIDR
jgi:hypothetical protein